MQNPSNTKSNSDFSEFIGNFEKTLKRLFQEEGDINQISAERGLPDEVRKQIMDCVPLSVAIPTEYGGRGCQVKECLGVLSAASYQALPLSLTFGINIALFLEPLAKYGPESQKAPIFKDFLENQKMGGLMITEPDFGSDALNMKTSYKELEDSYAIKGVKHWQGLTGLADYWVITSRKELDNGELARDIDFFLCDVSKPNQQIKVEEVFDNPGLYMIPYGRNILDIQVPKEQKMIPQSTGIKMMLDILHRSRLQFPGMGMGFIKRMMDEAIEHCKNRIVGKGNLLALDQVQFQLARIQSAFTICSAMCARSVEISSIENNLAGEGLEANSMKAVVTDLMSESAENLVQLSGSKGYRISHIGGRGIMDSRPFRIFEGSNEMLYSQIAEVVIKAMKGKKMNSLIEYLSQNPTTIKVADMFKNDLNFNVDQVNIQRKMVDLGRIMGRVVCAGYVVNLAEKGFNKDLIENCLTNIRHEVSGIVNSLKFPNFSLAIEDYQEGSMWWKFA